MLGVVPPPLAPILGKMRRFATKRLSR